MLTLVKYIIAYKNIFIFFKKNRVEVAMRPLASWAAIVLLRWSQWAPLTKTEVAVWPPLKFIGGYPTKVVTQQPLFNTSGWRQPRFFVGGACATTFFFF